jgi:hypothetical protein
MMDRETAGPSVVGIQRSSPVTEIAPILQILFAPIAVAAPLVLLVALLRGDEPGSLTNIWSAPDFDAWPRGVQEEEPMRWGIAAAAGAGLSRRQRSDR